MKFLFVAPRYHTNQFYLVKGLLDLGHQVTFFAQYKSGIEDYSILKPKIIKESLLHKILLIIFTKLKDLKLSNYFLGRLYTLFYIPNFTTYYKSIKIINPDVVITRGRSITSIITYLMCSILNIKCILYTQEPLYLPKLKKTLKSLYKETMIMLTSFFLPKIKITTVKGEKNEKNKLQKHKHTYYMPFVIEADKESKNKKFFLNKKINILSIGKFVPRKNHILLIKAIIILAKKYSIKLTIVGECSTKEHKSNYFNVKSFIDKNDLQNIVELKTNLSFSLIKEEYRKHDLFILPSRNEPAAISVLEAMAHSLPVICSDSNGTSCYIKENYNGYIFKSDDLNSLIDKINMMISNNRKIELMGKNSYELAIEKHNIKKYYNDIVKIVDDKIYN